MYKTSKYSSKVNQELEIRVLDVLNHSEDALSIQQIQQKDMILANHTPQKLARVLGKLIDMGFARKGKSKAGNRMMYKAVAVMIAQGYDVEGEIAREMAASAAQTFNSMPKGVNWELTTEEV